VEWVWSLREAVGAVPVPAKATPSSVPSENPVGTPFRRLQSTGLVPVLMVPPEAFNCACV
jgi:hypothetical protein